MGKKYIIDKNSIIKSNIHLSLYILLQIIYEKDVDLFRHFTSNYQGNADIIYAVDTELLKYTGSETLENNLNLDILDFILLEKATKLFVNDKVTEAIHEVAHWIGEYRNLFKGIKIGSMGDPNACLKKMKIFLKANPKYTKEQIFEATKAYIKNTEPKYTMQADYFISKVDANKVNTSRLFIWLEQIELVGEITDKSSLNKMI